MKTIVISLSALLLLSAAQSASAQDAMPAACGGEHAGHMMGGQMPGMTDTSGMSDMTRAYMEGMDRMHAEMMPGMMAEDPDVAFVCGMIAHHRGAIDMARIELQYGKDQWVKDLAGKIVDAQTGEIAEMTKWLEAHVK